MIIDAYSHVCPEPLLDAISARFPSDEVAALRKNSYLYDGARRIRIARCHKGDQAFAPLRLQRGKSGFNSGHYQV